MVNITPSCSLLYFSSQVMNKRSTSSLLVIVQQHARVPNGEIVIPSGPRQPPNNQDSQGTTQEREAHNSNRYNCTGQVQVQLQVQGQVQVQV